MPVAASAIGAEKKSAKAGRRSVPNPKPEKKVKADAKRATKPTIRKSIRELARFPRVTP